MSDFDKRYPHARTGSRQMHWPSGVHSISQDGLDFLGIDDDGQLYWDGKLVRVASPLELTTTQAWFAVFGVLSAVSLAVFDALRFFGYGSSH
jgi:hypothetical protein